MAKQNGHAPALEIYDFPSVALIEFSSIAIGVLASDAMVKKAPLAMFKAGTVHPGKFLTLIGGQVAPVEESYREGLRIAQSAVIDHVFLPDIASQVIAAVMGVKLTGEAESLGVIETSTVASNIKAADAAVKGAEVAILEIRLADDLGGNSFTYFSGSLENIQAAIRLGSERLAKTEIRLHTAIVPRADEFLLTEINRSSRFWNQAAKPKMKT